MASTSRAFSLASAVPSRAKSKAAKRCARAGAAPAGKPRGMRGSTTGAPRHAGVETMNDDVGVPSGVSMARKTRRGTVRRASPSRICSGNLGLIVTRARRVCISLTPPSVRPLCFSGRRAGRRNPPGHAAVPGRPQRFLGDLLREEPEQGQGASRGASRARVSSNPRSSRTSELSPAPAPTPTTTDPRASHSSHRSTRN